MKITLGDECLLSNGISIYSTDFHCIYSKTDSGVIINRNKDVCINNHVWVGVGTQILKGSVIETGSVVGAASLVAGKFNEKT